MTESTPARTTPDNPTPVHGCMIDGQPAMPILVSEYNRLVADLAALRTVARGYCPACGRGDAAPTVADWERQKQRADSADDAARRALAQRQEMAEERHIWQQRGDRAEAVNARARAECDRIEHDMQGSEDDGMRTALIRIRAALDEPGPATAQATEVEETARVFAALHRSAENNVSNVIALYEQWVKAGPPPLGTSISRWWDKRLVELRNAINTEKEN